MNNIINASGVTMVISNESSRTFLNSTTQPLNHPINERELNSTTEPQNAWQQEPNVKQAKEMIEKEIKRYPNLFGSTDK